MSFDITDTLAPKSDPRRFLTTDPTRPWTCVVCRDEDGDDQ